MFFAEERAVSKDGFGSMIDFESHKINRVVLSTIASELFFYFLGNVLELVSSFVVCGWTSVPRAWLFTCGPMQTIWLPPLPQPACRSKRKRFI